MPNPRVRSLPPRNDIDIWINNVLDGTNPKNADGTPNFVSGYTATWDLLDYLHPDPSVPETIQAEAALANNNVIASGVATYVADGSSLITISKSTVIVGGILNRYWLHVVITTPLGFVADLIQSFNSITRRGDSLTS